MNRRTASLVLAAAFLTIAIPAADAQSPAQGAPPIDRAVVTRFVGWWANETCDYAPDSDCGIATGLKDAMGLAGLGIDPGVWPAASDDVEAWVIAHHDEWDEATTLGPGPSLAMAVLALESTHDVSSIGLPDGSTRDLGEEIADAADENGTYGTVNANAWAAFGLALAADQESTLAATLEAIAAAQAEDGGWGWAKGQPSDPDTTGWALNALALGEDHEDAARRALDYLEGLQLQEGRGRSCWPGYDGNASAATTSVVLPALIAAGVDPEDWSVDGRSPWDCFVAFQEDDGSFATAFEAYQTARALGGAPLGHPTQDGTSETAAPQEAPRTTLTPGLGLLGALIVLCAPAVWRSRR